MSAWEAIRDTAYFNYFEHFFFLKLIENAFVFISYILTYEHLRTHNSCRNTLLDGASVSAAFLILLNFHSCYHNFMETRKAFSIFLKKHV